MWYIKRGYTFGYDFSDIPVYHCDAIKIPGGIPKAIYNCPWWVKPLLIFFSPSVYYMRTYGKLLAEGFAEGLKSVHIKIPLD